MLRVDPNSGKQINGSHPLGFPICIVHLRFEFDGNREIQQELSLLAISATVVNP